jgi:hypothetical protein
MPRYSLRTLLILLAIGPPLVAGAAIHPQGPLTFLLGFSPLFGVAFYFWRRLTVRGYI